MELELSWRRGLSVGLFVASLSLSSVSFTEVSKLSPEVRAVLQDSSAFRETHSKKDLPTSVVALCADKNGKLADPGMKWEATDFIRDSSLPTKRLIWAVTNNHYYIVHYERGGYSHSFHYLVAIVENDTAKAVWRGVGDKQVRNLAEFITALKADQLDDRLKYAP
jgi:hypothetical protein